MAIKMKEFSGTVEVTNGEGTKDVPFEFKDGVLTVSDLEPEDADTIVRTLHTPAKKNGKTNGGKTATVPGNELV